MNAVFNLTLEIDIDVPLTDDGLPHKPYIDSKNFAVHMLVVEETTRVFFHEFHRL